MSLRNACWRLTGGVLMLGFLQACASVPMASAEQDAVSKTFARPAASQAALYIFRDCLIGQALKRAVYLDGVLIGQTADEVYFHRLIPAGSHTLSTESEFGENGLSFRAEPGGLYFFRQNITMGLFVGSSSLEQVTEE